jgi:hypothetical protein
MCYDAGTYPHEIEFSDDSMKIMVYSDLLSVPSQAKVASTATGSPGSCLNMPASKLRVTGD